MVEIVVTSIYNLLRVFYELLKRVRLARRQLVCAVQPVIIWVRSNSPSEGRRDSSSLGAMSLFRQKKLQEYEEGRGRQLGRQELGKLTAGRPLRKNCGKGEPCLLIISRLRANYKTLQWECRGLFQLEKQPGMDQLENEVSKWIVSFLFSHLVQQM